MQFEITFDYLCPFARNANEAVLNARADGRDWEVRFRPFSLSQVHVHDGHPDVFDNPAKSGVLALQWGIAIRDHEPQAFAASHVALFAARHDHGLDIRDEAVIRDALAPTEVDIDRIASIVESGDPATTLAAEHTESVDRWAVFGVPTFIRNDVATFIRFMNRGSIDDLDKALDLLDWHELNEFKRTSVPR